MTKYTQKSFTVGGASKAYSDNYDRIFRQKEEPKEIDPAPSECWPNRINRDADIHDGAQYVRRYQAGADHRTHKEGCWVEVHRCVDCGREWEV